MNSQISRRDFLRLVSLLPVIGITASQFGEETAGMGPYQGNAPNVLVLVLDALSAKHVSLYGYDRSTTPNLERFAEKATVYHSHYSAGNFTTPGVASMLTGTYPWSHRAFQLYGTVTERYVERNLFRLLGSGAYQTAAYTHNPVASVLLNQVHTDVDLLTDAEELFLFNEGVISEQVSPDEFPVAISGEKVLFRGQAGENWRPMPSSLFLSMLHRFWRGAQRRSLSKEYVDSFPRGLPSFADVSLFFVLEDAIDWIEVQLENLPRPFMTYFHLLPPHDPYTPRREFVDIFDDGWSPVAKKQHFFSLGYSTSELIQKRREYDEYIAYADAEFGRLCGFMASTGLLDNTYVVLTSDHGEMFERGIWKHWTQTLYEPIIRVPLVISKPGRQQREDVYTPTSCVDLLPTFLQVARQPIPVWCEGEILPTFGDDKVRSDCSVFALEAKSSRKLGPLTTGTLAMIKNNYKIIHYFGYDGYESEYELYDLESDPEETEDLYLSKKSVAADLQSELDEKLRKVNQPYLGG